MSLAQHHDMHCNMCLREGLLMYCSLCQRATCNGCIRINQARINNNWNFLCLGCHQKYLQDQPYYGYYLIHRGHRSNGRLTASSFKPAAQEIARVEGEFQMSMKTHISKESLFILSIIVDGSGMESSPANVLFEYMKMFSGNHIVTQEITFGVMDVEEMETYRMNMQLIGEKMRTFSKTVIVVCNRSDGNTNGIFISPTKSIPGEAFFTLIFPTTFTKTGDSIVTLFMLSCPPLLQSVSLQSIAKSLGRLQFDHSVIFTSANLHPMMISGLLLEYGQQVVWEKLSVLQFLERTLPISNNICRNTDVIYIKVHAQQIVSHHFKWSHPDIRPWGNKIPVQCQCGRINHWMKTISSGVKFLTGCRNKRCGEKKAYDKPSVKDTFGRKVSGGQWFLISEQEINI